MRRIGEVSGQRPFWSDGDGDGYGAGAPVDRCAGLQGEVELAGDCDDADARFFPGALESCSDPNDYNCDEQVGYADADGDGFAACDECDDGAQAVNPDAAEVCNGVDDDCDGRIDLDAVDAVVWVLDADADGFTGLGEEVLACEAPPEHAAKSAEDDCDDLDADAYPGAPETPGDGVDQDCDGVDAPPESIGKPRCGCQGGGGSSGDALAGWLLLAAVLRRRRAAA